MTALDVLNHANWNYPDTMIGPASAPNVDAGRIIGSHGGRVIQLGLEVELLMRRSYPLLLALLAAATTHGALHAQTASVSIPAGAEEGERRRTPKFEATFNGKPASVISQLGPGSDQIILLVLDFTGEASRVEAAKQALAGRCPRNWPPTPGLACCATRTGCTCLPTPAPTANPCWMPSRAFPPQASPGLFETLAPALSLADNSCASHP